jgi:hypothetical protein
VFIINFNFLCVPCCFVGAFTFETTSFFASEAEVNLNNWGEKKMPYEGNECVFRVNSQEKFANVLAKNANYGQLKLALHLFK